MTSTMSHCWVRTLCAWVCKKCAKYHHIFAHLNAYPRNFMCVYNNGFIVDVIIASQNVIHLSVTFPVYASFEQQNNCTAKNSRLPVHRKFRYLLCFYWKSSLAWPRIDHLERWTTDHLASPRITHYLCVSTEEKCAVLLASPRITSHHLASPRICIVQ